MLVAVEEYWWWWMWWRSKQLQYKYQSDFVERVAPAIITIITAAPIDQDRVAVVVVEKYM